MDSAGLLAGSVEELEQLTMAQLTVMLRYEGAYDLFLHDTQAVREAKARTQASLSEEDADAGDAVAPELAQLQRGIQETQGELKGLLDTLRGSQERRQVTLNKLRTHAVVDAMQAAVDKREQDTDELLRTFTSGDVPTEEFLAAYTKQRKQFYTDRHKLECSGKVVAGHLVSSVTSS
eukprot:TRINITY_DN19795_c0_g1_i1.p2 TRINITY_DN19795_c0_g1~~TRINITY_DN19795_c0_g1_i1.p2  ORF type:complete len:177 (+),score=78.01 TRINITY_DN19795_c0_g1_i1:320-850(+)